MPPAVSFHNISKRFGPVKALTDVSFDVPSGHVHGLLGANGAGKSTLLKILSGVYRHGTYEGALKVRGQEVRLRDPDSALRQGIGYVPQEIAIIEPLTVAENIYVGRVGRNGTGRWVDRGELYRRADTLLKRNAIALDPRATLDVLAASQRQLVMIARALALDPAVLILDEATACLTERETENLFRLVEGFRARGLTTIFVTHRLREVEALADSVTVLRDGRVADKFDRSAITNDRMVQAMVGRTLGATIARAATLHAPHEGPDVLKVEGLSIQHPRIARRNVVENVSLHVRRGEILGIAGVVGAGRTEVLSAIYGRLPYTGQISVAGKPVRIRSPRDAHDLGIGLLTEERKKDGLLFNLPLFKNMTLSSLKHVAHGGLVLNDSAEERAVADLFKKLGIRAPSSRVAPATLSGGNQQKVILARLLLAKPKLLLLDEPTKGVDVGAKAEIYRLLFELAASGIGIVVVSSELPELLTLSDRIMVLARGRITDEMTAAEANEPRIMLASTGAMAASAAV